MGVDETVHRAHSTLRLGSPMLLQIKWEEYKQPEETLDVVPPCY